MNITEKMMDDLKAQVTEPDLKRMTLEFELLREITDKFDDMNDLYRFILFFSSTFIINSKMDIELFIRDIRRGNAAIIEIGELEIKGH